MKKSSKKLLITLGCSLTYGEGTENPAKQGWPPLLCEKMGFDKLINISGPGWSTSGAIKKMVQQLNFKDYYGYEVMVLFFLPDPLRFSFHWKDKLIKNFMLTDISDKFALQLFNDKPDIAAKEEQLFYIKIMEQICENNNWELNLLHTNYNIHRELIDMYPTDNWLGEGNVEVLTWDEYPEQHKEHTAPCNHPNERGYESVANRILKLLQNKFGYMK